MRRIISAIGIVSLVLSASAKIEEAIDAALTDGIVMGTPFADGMVLQRGMKVPVWGKVNPGGNSLPPKVTVSFAGQKKSAMADPATGVWKVELDPMEASKESRTMTVVKETGFWFVDLFSSPTDTVEIKDVLVGEVWFASGQSNMECPIWGSDPRYRDGKGGLMTEMTSLPLVRYAKNERAWSVEPKALKSCWCKFEPEDLQTMKRVTTRLGGSNTGLSLSAVAFYYARELYLALGVPIGIVDSSWGGTNIDAWTPRCGYEGCDKSIQATADYKVKADWDAKTDKIGPISNNCQQPTVLFNGMVDSWAPMAMRGFIWYQGCHNAWEPQLYCAKMHALYNGWSRRFENPDLKLYFVQLAPYDWNWNRLVAAQDKFVAEEPHAQLAVTADVGNFDDIHPNDKETVAQRLVVHALKRDYGRDIPEDCSPVFKSAAFGDGEVVLSFDHAESWYVYAPNRSVEPPFEVRGTNGVWTAARLQNVDKSGKIKGKGLTLKAEGAGEISGVRYMGRAKTAGTLYNQASLPLGPFEALK